MQVLLINIPGADEYPSVDRNVYRYTDPHCGSHGSPSVISVSGAPLYPSRCPFVARNPSPSLVGIINPATVMERSPTPIVMRHPGVSVFGHYPVSIGSIRHETPADIWKPDISILRVLCPMTVRSQSIVKDIYGNAGLCLCF